MHRITGKFAFVTVGVAGFAQVAFAAAGLMSAAVAQDWYPTQGSKENVAHTEAYRPIQSISYVLGTNKLSGYFQQIDGRCTMTLMLFKNIDAVVETPNNSTSRISVSVRPGEHARIDSAEGQGLTLTCNMQAETVTAVKFDLIKSAIDLSKNRKD